MSIYFQNYGGKSILGIHFNKINLIELTQENLFLEKQCFFDTSYKFQYSFQTSNKINLVGLSSDRVVFETF